MVDSENAVGGPPATCCDSAGAQLLVVAAGALLLVLLPSTLSVVLAVPSSAQVHEEFHHHDDGVGGGASPLSRHHDCRLSFHHHTHTRNVTDTSEPHLTSSRFEAVSCLSYPFYTTTSSPSLRSMAPIPFKNGCLSPSPPLCVTSRVRHVPVMSWGYRWSWRVRAGPAAARPSAPLAGPPGRTGAADRQSREYREVQVQNRVLGERLTHRSSPSRERDSDHVGHASCTH